MSEQSKSDKSDQESLSSPECTVEARKRAKRRQRFDNDIYYGNSRNVPRKILTRAGRRHQTLTHPTDLSTLTNLKDALYNSINDALSENTEIRRVAEDKISAMEITEEFAIHLCDFSLNIEFDLTVRQMSSVLLKNYIETYWATSEEIYVLENFVSRNRIRKNLIEGLKTTHSKIRNTIAYCVSYIAFLDYPDKWLTFFDDLHYLAISSGVHAVHGILRVYEDLIRDSDLEKMDKFATSLIAELCFILNSAEKFDIHVRIETVHVLCLCANVCGSGQNCVKRALDDKIMSLCVYFIEVLETEEICMYDYGFKTNIIRFFTLLVHKASKDFAPLITMILPTIWRMVKHYGEVYVQSVVINDNIHNRLDSEDDEGKVVGYTPLVLSLFDFIHSLVDCPKLNLMLYDVLTDIFYHIIIFTQITKLMEEAWLADPSNFVDEDCSDNFDTTIRLTARDVLMMICHDFDATIVEPHIFQAVKRHTAKLRFVIDDWRVHESLMFALGSTRDVIVRASFSTNQQFPLVQLATTWQFALNHPDKILLLGRALWFGGKFASILPDNILENYIKCTSTCVKNNNVILRIFSIRSIIAVSETLNYCPNKKLVMDALPTILESILENLANAQNLYFLFVLSLRALKLVLWSETSFGESFEPRVTPLIINILIKHHSDPEVISDIHQIVKEYSLNSQASLAVRDKFMPILSNILNARDEKVPSALQTVAMDLLQTIIKCSKPPLCDSLILVGFPATINCILNTDDQLLMSSGGECLRTYLMVAAEKICNYTDPEGKAGMEYILRALTHLLDPSHTEDACRRIGRLIITMINRAAHVVGTHMHYLLRAILSKMQRVETMEIWQSLLIVFVYLFYTELEFVMNFLTSVPGPSGQSALEFVLKEWFSREPYFTGSYDRTVSILALTKILEYSVTSDACCLDSITIRDEFILKEVSQKKEDIWTEISVLGKAFKIVVGEITYHLAKNARHRSDSDSNTEDELDFSDDDTESRLSDYRYYDNDTDQQDVLYSHDPIFAVNVLAHLTDFIQKFKTVPRFQWYVNLLTIKEKNTLAALGIF